MKTEDEIRKGLADMEIRKKAYLLDMAQNNVPNSVVYDTELIRKLEVTDATVHALMWVLQSTVPKEEPQPPQQGSEQSPV